MGHHGQLGRRLGTGLALALFLAACGTANPLSDRVELLTGLEACYAGGQHPSYAGLLVPDPQYGTRIEGKGPVLWHTGYTGRRLVTGQIQVFDDDGNVVATTGREYAIAPAPYLPAGAPDDSVPAPNCYAWDFVDCTPGALDLEAAAHGPRRG